MTTYDLSSFSDEALAYQHALRRGRGVQGEAVVAELQRRAGTRSQTPNGRNPMNIPRSDIHIDKLERHRNGIGGVGFWAVLFEYEGEYLLATVFDLEGDDAYRARRNLFYNPPTAVLHVPDIALGEIAEHKYRGDNFDRALREAIAEFEKLVQP